MQSKCYCCLSPNVLKDLASSSKNNSWLFLAIFTKKNIHLRGSSIQKFDAKIMRLLDAVFPKNLRMKELHVIFSANDEKFIMC